MSKRVSVTDNGYSKFGICHLNIAVCVREILVAAAAVPMLLSTRCCCRCGNFGNMSERVRVTDNGYGKVGYLGRAVCVREILAAAAAVPMLLSTRCCCRCGNFINMSECVVEFRYRDLNRAVSACINVLAVTFLGGGRGCLFPDCIIAQRGNVNRYRTVVGACIGVLAAIVDGGLCGFGLCPFFIGQCGNLEFNRAVIRACINERSACGRSGVFALIFALADFGFSPNACAALGSGVQSGDLHCCRNIAGFVFFIIDFACFGHGRLFYFYVPTLGIRAAAAKVYFRKCLCFCCGAALFCTSTRGCACVGRGGSLCNCPIAPSMRRFGTLIAANGAYLPMVCVVRFLLKIVTFSSVFLGAARSQASVIMLLIVVCPLRAEIVRSLIAVFLSADGASRLCLTSCRAAAVCRFVLFSAANGTLVVMACVVRRPIFTIAMRFRKLHCFVLINDCLRFFVRSKAAAYIGGDITGYGNGTR